MTVRILPSLGAIDTAVWDELANPGWSLGPSGALMRACNNTDTSAFNPFISHAFLKSLEDSTCVAPQTGWKPCHVLIEDKSGIALAAAPCYLKTHSAGEYVFDYGWADAFERAGGRYYPKLQAAVPFSPVTGRRLLCGHSVEQPRLQAALGTALSGLCDRLDASSIHITFADASEAETLKTCGYLHRTDQQFHWQNAGYETFETFLTALSARKRKAIRKERREAIANNLEIRRLTGKELTESVWDAFFTFYLDTGSRKWGQPYLNRNFFSLLGERLAERVLLVMAYRNGRPVAGALNLIGSDTLYGRNWGCIEDHPFLHFEICYYQAIEFAIEHGLARVEAGAQGAHKLARGYLPTTTHSCHWIAHPGLRGAVARYLTQERQAVAEQASILNEHTPFRKSE